MSCSQQRREGQKSILCLLVAALAALAAPAAAAGGGGNPVAAGAVPHAWAASGLHPAFRNAAALSDLIARLPKAELHLHIEGTLEVDMMFKMAAKNGIKLPYANTDAARAARSNFTCLGDFLKLFIESESVLQTEEDFYDLTAAYLARAHKAGVRRAEMAFDPQGHASRGVSLAAAYRGVARAMKESPVDAHLILTFERTRSEAEAALALARALPHLAPYVSVGLAGGEVGNPPSKFKRVFAAAPALGLHRVAHAGEEGGPDYVREALSLLGVERVDHGIRTIEDPALVADMAKARTPLTLCPISNLRLKVYDGELEARLREVLASGLLVTINSDDPAYFDNYINENYEYIARVGGLGPDELAALAANSFTASFASEELKQRHIASVWKALRGWKQEQEQRREPAAAWGRRAWPGWLHAAQRAASSTAGTV